MINTFTPLVKLDFFSKRFLMERYLGLTKDEIARNEVQCLEENPHFAPDDIADQTGVSNEAGTSQLPGLDDVGVHPNDNIVQEPDVAGDDGQVPDGVGTEEEGETTNEF